MVTSLDLINHFGLRLANGNFESLKRQITIPELDRCGCELLGYFQYHKKDRLLIIGNKENNIIENSSDEDIYKNALKLCNPICPGIIITQNAKCPEPLLKVSKETGCPIFLSDSDTNELISSLYFFLSEALAPKIAMHACLLEIYGIGVLILGESGIGKSEISLDLIKKGHRLIADDRVDIRAVRGSLIGTCPESIYGMMEVRGIGIIDVTRMFGINSLDKRSKIEFVVDLVPFEKTEPLERVGMKTERYEILGETIPIVKLPVSAARSMSEIIEAAVTNYKLKDYGYDTGYEFQKRLSEIQNKKMMEAKALERFIQSGNNPDANNLETSLNDEKSLQTKSLLDAIVPEDIDEEK